nr:site-specific integrase [uncultured Sediminibacterium sp.]
MENIPTITFFFDPRSEKKGGIFPIKLSVYYLGKTRRFRTKYSLSLSDWKKINSARLKDASLKDVKSGLAKVEQNAKAIIAKMEEFDFDDFKALYLGSGKSKNTKRDLVDLYNEIIEMNRKKGNEGSARAYQESLNAFTRFKKGLSFKDLTPEFLSSFEKKFLENKKSLTTVGIYTRQLRAVYNEAINRGLVKKELYPFTRYKIPGGYNTKKALTNSEIKAVMAFESESPLEQEAISFWKLSYLCGGMNIGDILKLKNENIQEKFILFNRSKTVNTKKSEQKTIQIPLREETKAIIQQLRAINCHKKDDLIFSVLNRKMTPSEEKDAIKSFNRKINQQLEKIATKLELGGRLSNMTARHSFATMLKRGNQPIGIISDMLGHSSLKTTQNYLGSFTDDTLLNATDALFNFD